MSGALDGAGVAGTVAVPSPVAWACRAGGSRSATKWRAWATRAGGGRPRRRGPAESGAEVGWTAPAAQAGAWEAGAVSLPSPGGRVDESWPGKERRRGWPGRRRTRRADRGLPSPPARGPGRGGGGRGAGMAAGTGAAAGWRGGRGGQDALPRGGGGAGFVGWRRRRVSGRAAVARGGAAAGDGGEGAGRGGAG